MRCICLVLGACRVSPNGSPGVDAVINTIAHELSEAATDPVDGTGWRTEDFDENADLCAWTYGGNISEGCTASGQLFSYNMVGRNGVRYMVQQNWDRTQQACTASLQPQNSRRRPVDVFS